MTTKESQVTKVCRGPCGRELPLDREHFHVDRTRSDGFKYTCKECRNHKERGKYRSRSHRSCRACRNRYPADADHFPPSRRPFSLGLYCYQCAGDTKQAEKVNAESCLICGSRNRIVRYGSQWSGVLFALCADHSYDWHDWATQNPIEDYLDDRTKPEAPRKNQRHWSRDAWLERLEDYLDESGCGNVFEKLTGDQHGVS